MGQGSSTTALSSAVQARLADFCLLADLAGAELLVVDAASGHYLACNDAACSRRGYSRSELVGMAATAIQADPDHDGAWLAERINELVAAGGGSFDTVTDARMTPSSMCQSPPGWCNWRVALF